MAKTAEILIKATDLFSDPMKKMQLQMAAAKIQADDFGKSMAKLQNLHPGLNADEARAAAEALTRMRDASEAAGKSFANANLTARGLGQELGITLPRSVTAFLAQSKLIGPALSAAFSTVAVVGIAEALGQLPAAYDKITGALTGWNDKSKEAYRQVLDDNKKAVEALTKFQVKMAEIGGGSGTGITLAEAQGRLRANTGAAVDARKPATGFGANLARVLSSPFGFDANTLIGGNGDEAAHFQANADQASKDVIEAQRAIVEEAKQSSEDLKKQQQDYTQYFAKQLETFKNSTFSVQVETHAFADGVIKDWKSMADEEQKAGDDFLEYQAFFAKQLEDFRIKAPGNSADIEAGVKAGDENAKKIIKASEEAQKQQKEFIKTFQDGIGKAWDDFRQKGFGAFADLASYVAKRFTEGLLTNLLFGSGGGTTGIAASLGSIGIGGGQGGGLLGGILGKIGVSSGPWSEKIPGLNPGGLLGGLGGLFGGPLGAGTSMGTGALSGAIVSAPAGGITGALGLGGGAGLLGLGAATIPLVGSIALGLGLALTDFFKHREAPFTHDPNETSRSREYLFYSATQNMAEVSKNMADFSHTFSTMPAGQVVKNGLPAALNSSNSFRRQINGVLSQDF